MLALLIGLLFGGLAFATTYYVDNSCSNNGNGQGQSCAGSPGGTGPFNSIANAQTALTGDQHDNSLLLKAAETFKEQYTVPAYGASGHPFTVGSYGAGAAPILDGASLVTGFIQDATSPWTETNSAAGVGATTAAFPNALTPGSIIFVVAFKTSDPATPTDSSGVNTYYDCGQGAVIQTATYNYMHLWYAINSSSASSVTVTSTSAAAILAAEYTGNVSSNPVDVYGGVSEQNTGTGGGQNIVLASVTTTANYDLVLGGIISASLANKLTPGPGFATVVTSGSSQNLYVMGSTLQGAGVISPTAADSQNSKDYAAITAAFKTSGSGTPVANVWVANLITEPHAVWFDGTLGTHEASVAALTGAMEWYWSAGELYVYATSDPASLYTSPGIEASQRNYGVTSNAEPYVTVQSLNITRSNIGGILLTGAGDAAKGNTISTVHSINASGNTQGWAILAENASGMVVDSNTISYTDWGIKVWAVAASADSMLVQNNVLSNLGGDAIAGYQSGGYALTNAIFQYNNISYAGLNSALGDSSSVTMSAATGAGNIIRYNQSSYCGNATTHGEGYLIQGGGSNIVVEGNISHDEHASCISETASTTNTFINNTCYNENLDGSGAIGLSASSASATYTNNIVHALSGKALVYASSGNTTGSVFDYNFYYGGSATPFHWVSTNYAFSGATSWQTTLSMDAHGKNVDPQFVNAAGGNFALSMTSPAIARGTTGGPATDLYGDPTIPGFVSLGAIQYQPRPAVGAVF